MLQKNFVTFGTEMSQCFFLNCPTKTEVKKVSNNSNIDNNGSTNNNSSNNNNDSDNNLNDSNRSRSSNNNKFELI